MMGLAAAAAGPNNGPLDAVPTPVPLDSVPTLAPLDAVPTRMMMHSDRLPPQ
jgi:hypothetical protein